MFIVCCDLCARDQKKKKEKTRIKKRNGNECQMKDEE